MTNKIVYELNTISLQLGVVNLVISYINYFRPNNQSVKHRRLTLDTIMISNNQKSLVCENYSWLLYNQKFKKVKIKNFKSSLGKTGFLGFSTSSSFMYSTNSAIYSFSCLTAPYNAAAVRGLIPGYTILCNLVILFIFSKN